MVVAKVLTQAVGMVATKGKRYMVSKLVDKMDYS